MPKSYKSVLDAEKMSKMKELETINKSCSATKEETKAENYDNLLDYIDKLSGAEKEKFLKAIALKKAKSNYVDYVRYNYPTYYFTKFHIFLCNIIQNVVERVERANRPNATDEDIKKGRVRLLLSVPPRHGKTEFVTKTAPSWFVGRNPDYHAILTAYNADMAEKFEDSNRQKTREHGKDIFGIEISDSQDNKTLYEIKNHKGCVMGVGIQGGITGNGGELIIVDDPYKNSAEANSPQTRQNIENIFRDSVLTRLQSKGNALIVIQTRWHEADLCGVLAKEEGWTVINIPAICEDEMHDPLGRKEGETLCPELGFDSYWAEQTRKAVGLKVWNALYMGKPTIDGGEVFREEMIKYYKKNELPLVFDELTMSCDLSFGGLKQSNDPCAIQVWGRVGANHYLLHRTKKRLTFNQMCEKIKSIRTIFPQIKRTIVEKKANGQSVIDTLNSSLGGFIPYDPKMDSKLSRANSVTYLLESGNVFLPDKSVDGTIEEMVEEMKAFPNGTHDDEVDALTQYLICSEHRENCGKVGSDNRFILFAKAIRSGSYD